MGFFLCKPGVGLSPFPAFSAYKPPLTLHHELKSRSPFLKPPKCSRRKMIQACQAAVTAQENEATVSEGFWSWKGYRTRYQRCGNSGPCVILVHGFGGNCDHWRKNITDLGAEFRVFSIDLLGFGLSDKPDPRTEEQNSIYCFEEWGQQVVDFIKEVAQEPSFLICNSIGGVVGLEAGITDASQVCGVQLLNISLRMLHKRNQPKLFQPFIKLFQDALYKTALGDWFFKQVAKPETVRNILEAAYCDKSTVTDELVDIILSPGMDPRAPPVFLAFICNSEGPLPDDQLQKISVPVSILWGDSDPWEKVEYGRQLAKCSSVKEFIELPGVGHCPHDEAPDRVNPLIKKFVEQNVNEQS